MWTRLLGDAELRRRTPKSSIIGGDEDSRCIELAHRNARRASVADALRFEVTDFASLPAPPGPGYLVTNPPYGHRLSARDWESLYRGLGDRMKHAYAGYDAWLLCGEPRLLKCVGLRPQRKLPVLNGNLECRFAHFPIRGIGGTTTDCQSAPGARGEHEPGADSASVRRQPPPGS